MHCPICGDQRTEKTELQDIFDEWNAEQFRARHEAIDRIMLAMLTGQGWLPDGIGCGLHDAPIQIHECALARRRAEAKKLMGNAGVEGGKR
jgi:hypothetical protein